MSISQVESRHITSTNRITLRLSNSILKILKSEADRKDIPLNALVTKILMRNIAENNINTLPNITLPCYLFVRILGSLDSKFLEELIEEGPSLVKKIFIIQGIIFELDEVIDKHFILLSKYCGWYKFTHEVRDRHYRLIFETDLGSQWIKFLTGYVRNILKSLDVHIEKEHFHDNIIVVELRRYGTG